MSGGLLNQNKMKKKKDFKILISACLLGERVRHDGSSAQVISTVIEIWQKENRFIPVCPEVLGGLSVPRPPAEIQTGDGFAILDGNSRVLTVEGKDVTHQFIDGAQKAYRLAVENNARLAIFKDKSPSCGVRRIFNGEFSGNLIPGKGVTTALLERKGIKVFSEMEINRALEYLQKLENEI